MTGTHRMTTRVTRLVPGLILGCTLVGAPATSWAGPGPEPKPSPRQSAAPVIPGPKRTVAVSRFASKSDFNMQYGLADVGGGLAAMLTAALVESGQFIVVERETLSDVLAEQNLVASGLVKEEGAPEPGNLLGAGLLIKGAVTDFAESAGGGSFGIGVAGVGLGVKSRRAVVGLDIQVIDATTSQVLANYTVRESITAKSVGIDVARMGVDTGFTKFFETPIGQATRKAITTAVGRFAEKAATRPWTGQVVTIDNGDVVINAGGNSGIKVGDGFGLERAAAAFTDPATGRVLGRRKVRLGRLVVTAVDDDVAFASYEPLVDATPERGDLVVLQ